MSYGQIGMMQALAGFYSWILTYGESGFMIRDLPNIRTRWDSKNVNDLEDSYGQNWVSRRFMIMSVLARRGLGEAEGQLINAYFISKEGNVTQTITGLQFCSQSTS